MKLNQSSKNYQNVDVQDQMDPQILAFKELIPILQTLQKLKGRKVSKYILRPALLWYQNPKVPNTQRYRTVSLMYVPKSTILAQCLQQEMKKIISHKQVGFSSQDTRVVQ